ncbi:MAG: hypothetical protein ACOX7N_00880 [Lawsonibacter sp.]|jgi:hypothetical protein
MEHNGSVEQWLDVATAGISFAPDRQAVWTELASHMEDKKENLMRIFPDLSPEQVQVRVLQEMGKPEEIGRELSKIYRPWWGWLCRISWLVLIAVGLAAFLVLTDPSSYNVAAEEKQNSWLGVERMEDWMAHQLGADKVVSGQPLVSTQTAQVGEYTVQVDQLERWTARGLDGEEEAAIYLVLKVSGRPWESWADRVREGLWAEDDRGNVIHFMDVPPGTWDEGILSGVQLERKREWERLEYIIPLPDQQAERLTLRYTDLGVDFSLPISIQGGTR